MVQPQAARSRLEFTRRTLQFQSGENDLTVCKRNHYARFAHDFHARDPCAERHDPPVHGEYGRNRRERKQKHKDRHRPDDDFQQAAQTGSRFRLFRFVHMMVSGYNRAACGGRCFAPPGDAVDPRKKFKLIYIRHGIFQPHILRNEAFFAFSGAFFEHGPYSAGNIFLFFISSRSSVSEYIPSGKHPGKVYASVQSLSLSGLREGK